MIERDQLPDDPADWGELEVSFPRLSPDTTEFCPGSSTEILEYIGIESADVENADPKHLRFLRTAQVGDDQCWIWSYTEVDGDLCYVTYWVHAAGGNTLGMSSAKAGYETETPLTPEQYMLAEYHELIYW